jgi:tetratricopeptide (TPR) repeat protein
MGEQAADGRRYTAFLSYSHRDAAAALRLHRRLEAYRMPKRLVGRETARGPVPERLAPIFRDREELPAATDLSETVREALAQSGALIILCSPNSAGSLWVAEEIRTFRALHPDRPILAAVLDGDPPDCFPAALRAFGQDGTWHEPLATDLRPNRDGARLGLLKLVAGITGVGLDALVQRDAARRIRRVMAVTAAAVIAMLITTALAVVAVSARREAERQRAEAEGLVEFMLTDLRTRLRGVGRIEIMQTVNERALRYYSEQVNASGLPDASGLSSDSLLRRARILHAIGADEVTSGNLTAALAAYREAHRTTAEQLARAPDDPRRILEHGRSEYGIGRVHELRREWPAAQRRYARFAAAAERLLAHDPANPEYLMVAGSAAVDLGNIELNGNENFPAARRLYERAVDRFGHAARADPADTTPLIRQADGYGWLADSLRARNMLRESLAARLAQERIAERLYRAQPGNLEFAFRFALARRAVASTYALLGDKARARPRMFEARQWAERLGRRDPRNAEWLLFRGMVGCELYFRGLGFPPGTSRAQVGEEVRSVAAALRSQHNPRVAELGRCPDATGSRPH